MAKAKKRHRKAAARRTATRAVGRRRSGKAGSGIDSLAGVVSGIQELQRDRGRYGKTLTRIRDLLDGELV